MHSSCCCWFLFLIKIKLTRLGPDWDSLAKCRIRRRLEVGERCDDVCDLLTNSPSFALQVFVGEIMGAVRLEVVVMEQYCSTFLPVLMKSPANDVESVQQQQQQQQRHCCNVDGAKSDDEVGVHNDARTESAARMKRPKEIWHL